MNNTVIFVLFAIAVVGVIFWLVIYAARRGDRHREQTSLKAPDSRGEGQTG